MKPVFIFSLPRSGSTMLQRILAVSDQISTAAEPWMLLPFVYSLKPTGAIAEYWHGDAVGAIEDFYNGFADKKEDYERELRKFFLALYEKYAGNGDKYFLEKTPRNSLICDDIMRIFPDAKFIFLWRNPLAIASSILSRWCHGKWKIMTYNIDLYKGLRTLLKTFIKNRDNVFSLNYENLIQSPEKEVKRICEYLEIDFEENMLRSFYDTPLEGRMVERSGSKNYGNRISKGSLDTWKTAFDNPFRLRWARKYISWIGDGSLKIMGYDYSELYAGMKRKRRFSFISVARDVAYEIITRSRMIFSLLRIYCDARIKYPFR